MCSLSASGNTARHPYFLCAGFTIVELLVTLVIVSILACGAFPMAELVVRRNKEQVLLRGLMQIRNALDAYKRASEDGQIVHQQGDSGFPPNLQILVDGVTNAKSSSGARLYFLRRLPRDPFNDDSALPAADTWRKRSYASTAQDPKEGADVYDVFSSTADTGLNGVPYREW